MWRELLLLSYSQPPTSLSMLLGTYALLLWLIRLAKRQQRFSLLTRALSGTLCLVAALVLLHSVEILIWAQFFLWSHCLPDRETAYVYRIQDAMVKKYLGQMPDQV